MTTRKEAAFQLLGLAREIAAAVGGDEDAESWIQRLVWLADDLGKPDVQRHPGTTTSCTATPTSIPAAASSCAA